MKTILFILLLSIFLAACKTVSYYGQAVSGQLYILSHGEDIEGLIEDEFTNPELRAKLVTILEIRQFAEQELFLPLEDNYQSYVDVGRPFVVWNVFATPEFSMEPLNWCFPIAGCVTYRGYFSEVSANDFAEDLIEKDYDVYVGGVAAYSTLGWFSDPVLNTVIRREDYQLASLIFHELAHQLLYIPGDTEFNESFATAVEQEGLKRWLAKTVSGDDSVRAIIDKVEQDRNRREQFVGLVKDSVSKLEILYASDNSKQSQRMTKQEIFTQLKQEYQALKRNWNAYSGYDSWFSRELNNAQLNTVAIYFNWVPAFETMLLEAQGDLRGFYALVATLSELDEAKRQAFIELKMK